jgi:hypothetical protein
MGAINCQEIREGFDVSPLERAKLRDLFVRQFEAQWADWTSIAKTCIAIDQDRDWELLGYRSFGHWIVDAAPRSRAYLYLVMGRYRELISDISEAELREISLGSAGVLKLLSPAARRQSKIRLAAKGKPAELRKVIHKEMPLEHIEETEVHSFHFESSAWERIEEAYEIWKTLNDPQASIEEFLEERCAEYADSSCGESGYSNRERAAQLASLPQAGGT